MQTQLKLCSGGSQGRDGSGWHIGSQGGWNYSGPYSEGTGGHDPGGDTTDNDLYFAVQYTDGDTAITATIQDNRHSWHQMNFTGQHRCVPNNINYYNNIDDFIGLIVYATGDYKTYDAYNNILYSDNNAISVNDSLPIVELTCKKKDKAVFGIISDKEEENRRYSAGNFATPISNLNDDKRLYINSLGEGAIWVVNTNGNLENGDYIQSSDVLGMGEKQDSEFLANYTVAKITCNCDFDLNSSKYKCESFVDSISGNTYIKAFVGCTYHCG